VLAKLDSDYERKMARMDSKLEETEAAMGIFEERLNGMDAMDLEADRG
jgi:hypothetical protein